jgi:hypothetical protein
MKKKLALKMAAFGVPRVARSLAGPVIRLYPRRSVPMVRKSDHIRAGVTRAAKPAIRGQRAELG